MNNPAHISALAGGAIFNFGSAYEGDQAKMIKRLLDKGVSGDSILDNEKKIERGLKAAYKAYQDWGNKSEAANRMALYNQLKRKRTTAILRHRSTPVTCWTFPCRVRGLPSGWLRR
jgi:hypothetical protein